MITADMHTILRHGWDHCVVLLTHAGIDAAVFAALRETYAWRQAETTINESGRAGDVAGIKAGYRQLWALLRGMTSKGEE